MQCIYIFSEKIFMAFLAVLKLQEVTSNEAFFWKERKEHVFALLHLTSLAVY